MRILILTYGLPYPLNSGSRIRDFNLIKCISRHHSVYLLSLLEVQDEIQYVPVLEKYCEMVDVVHMKHRPLHEHFKGMCRSLHEGRPLATHPFYYSEMTVKIQRAVESEDIDIIQIEHSFLAPYVHAVPGSSRCRKVLSFHNIGVKQYRSILSLDTGFKKKALFFLKWMLMLRWEARYAGYFHHCIAVTTDEGRLLKSLNPGLSVTVIDNGVDTGYYQPLNESLDENTVLYTGTMGYPPNVDAVLYFYRSIMPLIARRIPDIKLIVAGRCPADEIRRLGKFKNIVVQDNVTDIVSCYQKSRVSIVPLRAGGGSRLKILESMALGRPVVSTSVGAEGLSVSHSENIIIADTPTEFAEGVIMLLKDRDVRSRISRSAREVMELHYDWSIISKKLMALYGSLKT